MVGEGLSKMETIISPWNTHDWNVSCLELVPGQPIIHQVCVKCRRGFVEELSTDKRYAIHASIFRFYRLSDEVTARWLSEKCPAKRLSADEADVQTRSAGGSSYPAISELAYNGLSPNGKVS
jgi:hypothetical protein